MTRLALLALLLLACSAGVARASGHDRGRDAGRKERVRVTGDCGRGASSSLRVEARVGGIDVRFRLQQLDGRGVWRILIVHENRVSVRATSKTTRSEDSFEVRRTLPDLRGSDIVAVRAWGPGGLGCLATATLADSG